MVPPRPDLLLLLFLYDVTLVSIVKRHKLNNTVKSQY